MGTLSWVWIATMLASLISFVCTVPFEFPIDCTSDTFQSLGEVDEGYSGDLETTPNIPDDELRLETSCSQCEEFLELSFIPSVTNATVRTKKPLDAEALKDTNGFITYHIICTATGVRHTRTLQVRDVNDHPPVFDREEYKAEVSETLNVGEVVIRVEAVDADFNPINNFFTYSIQAPTTTFEINYDGEILLKEHLNSTNIIQYNLTVKAQDRGGLFSETRVIINIIDKVNLMFEYDVYDASIPENQLGPVPEVLPAPLKANVTGNHTVIYSIREVFPSNYWSNFTVDQSKGVIQVVTELDFEEIRDPIIIHIKASLETDSTRTANTMVTVHVKDVNEAPVFNLNLYTAEIFSAAPTHQHVVKVEATDPDVGDTLQYSLVEPSSMFGVEPSSGQVYVVSVAGESGKVSLQVKAEDQQGLYDTTTVEVKVYAKNVNEAPVFNAKLYTAEIFSVALTNQHVVKVEAADPDVGDTLLYSLVEPSSIFAVEPSSGQVYVVPVAGESGKVSLQVKAEDQQGLYDTTTVEVTIKESDSKDVVSISVNQEIGTVQKKTNEMEKALERALGWSVTIISVRNSIQGSALSRTPEIPSVQRKNTPKTYVSFLATEINGTNIIPKDTVKKKLLDDKENLLEEMEQVFGKGFQFDIVDDGDHTANTPTTTIILVTVISLVAIAVVGFFFIYKFRYRQPNSQRDRNSSFPMHSKGDSTNRDSMKGKPDLKDRDSMKGKPDEKEGADSMKGKPDVNKGTGSMKGRPDLKEDTDTMRGKPDLMEDTDAMKGKPDLARRMPKKRPKLELQ